MTKEHSLILIMSGLFLLSFFIYHVQNYLYDRRLKNLPDTGTWVNFFDELKSMMSAHMNSELQYADNQLGRHLIFKYLDHKSTVNSRKIDCCSVKIRFMLKTFKDGRRENHADTESHYGQPEFYQGKVNHNYSIGSKSFVSDVNQFSQLWKEILEYHFSVKFDGKSDNVKIA